MQFVQKQETQDVLQWTIDLVTEAGQHARGYFGSTLTKEIKGHPNDYATNADIAIEQFLVARIQERFPGDAILAEEGGWYGGNDAEHVWIIDPIDGTSNFANDIPEYGVMVARTHGAEITLSVVYNPSLNFLASAGQGKGTFLNGTLVHAPATPHTLAEASIVIGMTYAKQQRSLIQKIRSQEAPFTQVASYHSAAASVLHVLLGDCDGWMINTMKPWDTAPVALLLQEAGYTMTTLSGTPYSWQSEDQSMLVAPPQLYEPLKEYVIAMDS